MARKPSQKSLEQYDALKRFFAHWLTHVCPLRGFELSDSIHPLNVLASFENRLTFSQCFLGLKQAVGDSLEGVEDWPTQRIMEADESLRRAGAPTLSEMLVARAKSLRKVLRRGKIQNDTEYYLVSAAVSDVSAPRSTEETERFAALLAGYESKA